MIRLKPGLILVCKDCQSPFPRTGPRQFYCHGCSEERSRARKRGYARNHPKPAEESARRSRETRGRVVARGLELNGPTRWPVESLIADESGFVWVRRLAVPFTYALSKNHMASMRGCGHVFLRKETRVARRAIADSVRFAIAGAPLVHAKLWIDLLVQKPNQRGDAINVLDVVSDAIKDAVAPLDDRWFSFLRLDWQIIKDSPQILIGLAQKDSIDHLACSHCGRILPSGCFMAKKGGPLGRGRCCRDCEKGRDRRKTNLENPRA